MKKKGWKTCINKEVVEMYNNVLNKARELYPQYFSNGCKYNLYIDSRSKCLGRCCCSTERIKGELINKEANIILSKYILSDATTTLKTIVHEIGHAITPGENHGYLWHTRTNKLAKMFNLPMIDRLADEESSKVLRDNLIKSNVYKYSVKCSGCGRIVYKTKLCSIITKPGIWKCGVCGSYFTKNN